jgi:hypothetical protein
LKTHPSGSAGGKKKSWPFYGHLQFLIPHVVFRETTGNYACETPTESHGESQIEAPEEQQGQASSDISLEPQEQSETHISQQLQEIEEIPELRNKRAAVKRNIKRPRPLHLTLQNRRFWKYCKRKMTRMNSFS